MTIGRRGYQWLMLVGLVLLSDPETRSWVSAAVPVTQVQSFFEHLGLTVCSDLFSIPTIVFT